VAKKRKKSKAQPSLMIEDRDWRARHDYETLCSASEISRDSARMRGVRSHAKEQREKAQRIQRLEGKLL
jgi:hypothetical protein